MKEARRKNKIAMAQPAIIDEPVAFDGVANLVLHHRDARKLDLKA
jgi:hypothetical protein